MALSPRGERGGASAARRKRERDRASSYFGPRDPLKPQARTNTINVAWPASSTNFSNNRIDHNRVETKGIKESWQRGLRVQSGQWPRFLGPGKRQHRLEGLPTRDPSELITSDTSFLGDWLPVRGFLGSQQGNRRMGIGLHTFGRYVFLSRLMPIRIHLWSISLSFAWNFWKKKKNSNLETARYN